MFWSGAAARTDGLAESLSDVLRPVKGAVLGWMMSLGWTGIDGSDNLDDDLLAIYAHLDSLEPLPDN
ncbi:hypothetical protein HC891_05090 [Candidatus Gracilibacteria bacterium]|nr:hypothetical protein [Candidatus Gracilibacteria bacterium]